MNSDATRSRPGEVYFEFIIQQHAIKVSAVDAATGTEVSIVGSRNASQRELEAAAMAKLDWVMRKPKRKDTGLRV